MKEQLSCTQTEGVTKVSSCDEINMPLLKFETEQIYRNDSTTSKKKLPHRLAHQNRPTNTDK